MRKETRNLIIERYTGWAELWGLSFAFAVTQSVEKAERAVADAIVALIAAASEEESDSIVEARVARFRRDRGAEITESPAPIPPAPRPGELIVGVSAQRFAAVLWELSSREAYRGFGADPFFRMPAVARAVVILKIRAQFSRNQIAGVVRLSRAQVEDHLENARLLFSDGRPWVETGPGLLVQGAGWAPECPQWSAAPSETRSASENIQDVFAQYIGNDLDTETGGRLHSHLVVCNTCRTSFAYFKRQYNDWIASIPAIDTAPEMRKHLSKITGQALKARRRRVAIDAPSAWPGIFKVIGDGNVRAMVYGATMFMVGQVFLHKHPSVLHALKRLVHFR